MRMNQAFWRRWHRWIGFPAALFLLFASVTGILVAFTEFFGEEEALREATRDLVSPVTLQGAPLAWSEPLAKAFGTGAATMGNAPVDKVTIQFKGNQPTVTMFIGKPSGREDRKLVLDAKTGVLVKVEVYADKPFLYRLHSGEAFGDGGLVLAMLWGLALALIASSGLVIYLKVLVRRPEAVTWFRRVFW